ncbi:MAG: urease accessory UreF family protein [Pseudomonadota bacterium]
MSSTADRLTLARWLSPSFPLGSFAYSHGLEAAVEQGAVATADALCAWSGDVLRYGSGKSDAILLALALKPGADWVVLAAWARALAASRERWVETRELGTAFTDTTNAIEGTAHAAAPLPVAVGRAASRLDLPAEEVVALYLQNMAAAIVSAGVRFIPLGQVAGQGVQAALAPIALVVAHEAIATDLDAITTGVPMADLAAMAHETMDVRIFLT